MKPARILLLVVAVVAGGLAAFLATRGDEPASVQPQVEAQVVREVARQVLVASANIGVGQRLNETVVEWQDWPEGMLRDEYITSDVFPDADAQMVGTVARFEIFTGEPIRQSKLIRTDQGYLSAVIEQGMRAVSVGVSAESGAGGFIVPNDRVDVVQTYRANNGTATRTILANIRVLAIGQRLGEVGATSGNPDPEDPQAQMFEDQTIATLELDPSQSETIIGAAATGELSLVLRSVADFSPDADEALPRQNAQTIRLIRFGNPSDITSNTIEQVAASVTPTVTAPVAGPLLLAPAYSGGINPLSQNSSGEKSSDEDSSGEVPLQ